jgi:hypothetical protein
LVIVEFPLSEDQINDEPYASWRGEQAARGSAKVTVVRLYNVSADVPGLDADLETKEFRRVALRHALLSFVFGTGILATTINLVASLSSK